MARNLGITARRMQVLVLDGDSRRHILPHRQEFKPLHASRKHAYTTIYSFCSITALKPPNRHGQRINQWEKTQEMKRTAPASHPACAAMRPKDAVCSTEKKWHRGCPCSLDAAQAAYEERSAVHAPWGCQQEHHARKFRHGRAPGAANMRCTSRSFAENMTTMRPGKLGRPMPTAETGPARDCGPRAKP